MFIIGMCNSRCTAFPAEMRTITIREYNYADVAIDSNTAIYILHKCIDLTTPYYSHTSEYKIVASSLVLAHSIAPIWLRKGVCRIFDRMIGKEQRFPRIAPTASSSEIRTIHPQ
jgi:hypothetical protein